jgi:hypothetical protein
MINMVMLIAMGAWAFSILKKAIRGEEIARPF